MLIKVSEPKNHLWKNQEITGIHAEFTDKCNSGCPMCPRYINHGSELNPNLPKTEVTLDQFKDWFSPNFIKNLKKLYACGNYGDPIAAKDTLEIYQHMRELNNDMALSMHTNGSARTTDWWAALGKTMNYSMRGDYCTFSIDGLADTNHLYRRNTNFEKIISNAKAFIAAGGIAHWDYIVFEHNEHQVELAKDLAIEMGFENFNVKRTTRWAKYSEGRGEFEVKDKNKNTDYFLRQPLNNDFKDETIKILKENLKKPNYITEQEFDKLHSDDLKHRMHDPNGSFVEIKYNEIEIQCRAIKGPSNSLNEIFLSATGHVFPCCFLGGEPWRYSSHTNGSQDNFMKMIELNGGMDSLSLHKENLDQILNSPVYSELLGRSFTQGHSMRSRQCSTCCGKTWNKLDHGEIGNKQTSYLDTRKNQTSGRG